jgi:uncharacterized protein with PIN domain
VDVSIRFHGELGDHLAPEQRERVLGKTLVVPGSVKDLIESYGVPHTETGRIEVNGETAGFAYVVGDGDRIEVWPLAVFGGEARFVLDVHLGKLAAYLRMIGFDTVYRTCFGDAELVRVSVREGRALLTRDRGLLKHGALERGYWLRETDSRRQLAEIVRRFGLAARMRPFTRCMACNGVLREAAKVEVAAEVPERVAAEFDEFRRCPDCGRVYWRGSHYRRMQEWVEALHCLA